MKKRLNALPRANTNIANTTVFLIETLSGSNTYTAKGITLLLLANSVAPLLPADTVTINGVSNSTFTINVSTAPDVNVASIGNNFPLTWNSVQAKFVTTNPIVIQQTARPIRESPNTAFSITTAPEAAALIGTTVSNTASAVTVTVGGSGVDVAYSCAWVAGNTGIISFVNSASVGFLYDTATYLPATRARGSKVTLTKLAASPELWLLEGDLDLV